MGPVLNYQENLVLWVHMIYNGLYYKIKMIVSDDRKWTLYYKIIIMIESAFSLS